MGHGAEPVAPDKHENTALHREMTSVGGGLFTAGGVLVLAVVFVGQWDQMRRPVLMATGAIAVLVGLVLLSIARRHPLPTGSLAALAVLGTANITVTVVGSGPDGAAAFGVLYVFVVVFSLYYFPTTLAVAEVVVSAMAYAIGLQFVAAPDPAAQWLVVTGGNVIIGSLIGRGGKRVRDLLVSERHAVARLRELDELRTSFLRAVSHELRTPLTAVVGISETLRDHRHELDELQTDLLIGRIGANGQRLQQLLGNLLDIDRISRGVVQAVREPADLGLLARRVVAEMTVGQHHVHVDVIGPCTMPVEASKAERIVENLVANAVRHTPDGTNVHVTVRDQGSGVVLSVEDDGPGIPERLRATIFEPFVQGEGAAQSPQPGTGIGLSLVAKFAELHGGRAWVSPSSWGGAGFHVHLPREDHDPMRVEPSPPVAVSGPRA